MHTQNEYSRRDFLIGAGMMAAANTISAGQANKVPVIDCHSHGGTGTEMTDPWTTYCDPEGIIRRNQEAGIDKSCIFAISLDTYEEANREIAQIVKRYPGRFIGYARHNPEKESGRIRGMLLRECRELGLRGLKMRRTPTPEVLDTLAELGIPLIWHPDRMALFEPLAKAYPTVDFILAHVGSDLSANWRDHEAGIEVAKHYPNVYLDTSATVLTRYIEQAVKEVGPEKVIFGSDEPEVDCRLEIFKIRMLKLPKEQEEMILGGTMLRLLSKYKGGAA